MIDKIIKWFTNYTINKSWEVKNIKTWKLLSWWINQRWYRHVNLRKNWRTFNRKIHRLLAMVFIETDNYDLVINHIDWNKLNNNLNNLEWCTQWYNIKHAQEILWYWNPSTWKLWKQHWSSKSIIQLLNWREIRIWDSISDIVRLLKYDQWSISKVCAWKRLTAYWYNWKFNI